MFEKIRKCLDDFENMAYKNEGELTREDKDTYEYFNLRFAEAIMSECWRSENIAMIILSEKCLLNEVKVKFER